MEREGAPVDPIGGSANATRSEIALPDGAVIELERTENGKKRLWREDRLFECV